MLNRKLVIGLIILAVLTIVVSLTTIIGFFIRDLEMVLLSAKILSLSSLILMTIFFRSVYGEMFGDDNVKEVRMELKNKEDIERFRKELEEHLQDYIKEVVEEEEKLDKDE